MKSFGRKVRWWL